MKRDRAASTRCRLSVALIALTGCTGSADLQFVSTNLASINPPPPIIYRYEPRQCFWWLDDDGSMNIAMQFDNVSLFSEMGKLRLQVSLAFDSPPAGSGRDYRIGPRTVRGRFETAMTQARLISSSGVIAISKPPDKHIRGSFRMLLQQFPGVSLFTLTAQKPGNYLMFGTFDAIEDAERGRAIRDATEADGWTRPPTKTDAPAHTAAR